MRFLPLRSKRFSKQASRRAKFILESLSFRSDHYECPAPAEAMTRIETKRGLSNRKTRSLKAKQILKVIFVVEISFHLILYYSNLFLLVPTLRRMSHLFHTLLAFHQGKQKGIPCTNMPREWDYSFLSFCQLSSRIIPHHH